MKRKRSVIFSIIVMGLFAISPVLANEVAIPGTGDGVDVLKAIGDAFERENSIPVRIPKSIGSGGAVKVVGADKAILGRVARNIKDKEKHFGLEYKAIFEIPTVIFVNKNVQIDGLSEQQVVDIFSGKITNWKEVGGNDAEIIVVKREDKDSSLNNLKKTFPGFSDLQFAANATLAEKTYIMVAQVVNRADSIGFGPLDVALANDLKPIAINGKKPTAKDYPYFGTIGLVYKTANLDDASKQFVEFASSPTALDIITKAGGRSVN